MYLMAATYKYLCIKRNCHTFYVMYQTWDFNYVDDSMMDLTAKLMEGIPNR
jgi:hypothetical protein